MYTTSGRPATRHDREIVEVASQGTYDVSDIIVFVALDVEAVRSIIDDLGDEVLESLRERLTSMANEGEIDINREYRVMSTVTLTGTLEHVVEASSADAAEDLVREMIECGDLEDPDTFVRHADVDDVTIDDVEEA